MQQLRAMHGCSCQPSKATSQFCVQQQPSLPRLCMTWPVRTLCKRACLGDGKNITGDAKQQHPEPDVAPHSNATHSRKSSRRGSKRAPQGSRVHDAALGQKASEPLPGAQLQQPGGQSWQQQWQKQNQRQRYPQPRRQQQLRAKSTRSHATYPDAASGNRTSSRAVAAGLRFSSCSSFASMHTMLLQLEDQPAQQQQHQQVEACALPQQQQSEQQSEQQQKQQQQKQQQQQYAGSLLTASDTVHFMQQLSAINEGSHNSSSMSDAFVEGQALQQLLPLAYKLLAEHASAAQAAATSSSPTGLPPAAELSSPAPVNPAASALGRAAAAAAAAPAVTSAPIKPWQLLQCVSHLASLKYSQPEQLAAVLDEVSAARLGLSGLSVGQLAALTGNLARAGVRPSKVWLVALMQAAQAKLPSADIKHLSQILSGLVRMGVKPAAAWMSSLEDQAVQCLIEQAVRHHVVAETSQQQQQQQQHGNSSTTGRPDDAAGGTAGAAGGLLQAVAALLTAFAEARHVPQPQVAAALWGATGPTLAAAGTASLVDVLTALGELQLVPPEAWMQQYFSSTVGRLEQYRPWQLAVSMAALGSLSAAGLKGCRQQQQQQHNYAAAAGVGCAGWVQAVLSVVEQRMTGFSARDLTALLEGLAALELKLPAPQLQQLLAEATEKLPRFNPAGLAGVTRAVVQLEQQHRQHCGSDSSLSSFLLSETWMAALLRETAQKLPVFGAHDLSGLLVSVQASGFRPSSLWVEAAAAQLYSKLTVLEPRQVVDVLGAVMDLGCLPQQQWVKAALAALDGRLTELDAGQMEVLLQRLVVLGAQPTSMWLETAAWALQQQEQQQQAEGVIAADRQETLCCQSGDVCRHLLQQLKQNVAEDSLAVEAACSIQV